MLVRSVVFCSFATLKVTAFISIVQTFCKLFSLFVLIYIHSK